MGLWKGRVLMRVLWITNQATPVIADAFNIKTGFGGGWMVDLSRQLSCILNLGIAFPVSKSSQYTEKTVEDISCFAFPCEKTEVNINEQISDYIKNAVKNFNPDVVHIWGTEYIHSYLAVLACNSLNISNVVVSIQGMVSIYHRHFWGFIEDVRIWRPTLIDFYKRNPLLLQYKMFEKRGYYEIEVIKNVNHIIGRTDWDRACTYQIKPQAKYHFCNETLRDAFYKADWSIESCERHTLFVSQCQYPIKGFHLALEALRILVKKYPDAKLYTTGRDCLKKGAKERLKDTGYQKYIRKFVLKNKLEDHVVFLGALNEVDMRDRFLKSHTFVSASSIENSPNSVGEAMLLGVPTVSSDVGGVKNLMEHGKEGFVYQADAPYMLAYYVDRVWSDDNLAVELSRNAQTKARVTHDPQKNLERLMKIYEDITCG